MMRWILEKSQGREVTIMMSLSLVPGAVSELIALGGLYPSSSPVSWDLE